MASVDARVGDVVGAELCQPVSGAVEAAAAEIRRRHGPAVAGCLFYGSCLRDGRDQGRVIDFYVLADDYRTFYGRRLPSVLNALLPPNVYYLETAWEGRTVRAKYAVISLEDLRRDTSAAAFQPTIWGRLAQPCALVQARNAGVEDAVTAALGAAIETLALQTLPLMAPTFTPRELWTRGFAESYRTELRAERSNRPRDLYDCYAARYDAVTAAALARSGAKPAGDAAGGLPVLRHGAPAAGRRAAACRWWLRRVIGKTLHVLRLFKAAYTFTDGLDYILWKIEQHSGIRTEPTPWQRRHPLMAAPGLAWRLYRRRAFR